MFKKPAYRYCGFCNRPAVGRGSLLASLGETILVCVSHKPRVTQFVAFKEAKDDHNQDNRRGGISKW